MLKLAKHLPLTKPLSIIIDPCNLCNLSCSFCPTSDKRLTANRHKGTMPIDLFCKIIDSIENWFGEVDVIWLVKDGEPLLNPFIDDMIFLSKRVAKTVKLTTNGILLTEYNIRNIIDTGLDYIKVSVNDIKYDLVKENVRRLFELKDYGKPLLVVKMIEGMLDKDKFEKDFKYISDGLLIDNLMGWSNSSLKDFTLGKSSIDGMSRHKRKEDRIVCPEPFKTLAVNIDGTVGPCCVDWRQDIVFGSSQESSIKEIWEGGKLKEFRLRHLRGQRNELLACRDCDYIKGVDPISDLDDDRNRLEGIYDNR